MANGRITKMINDVKNVDDFVSQGNFSKKIQQIKDSTKNFNAATFDETHLCADILTNLKFATPVINGEILTFDRRKEGLLRELLVFADCEEMLKYKKENNCGFAYICFDDLYYLLHTLEVDIAVVVLSEGNVFSMTSSQIEYWFEASYIRDVNEKSELVVGTPTKNYDELKNCLIDVFAEFVNKMWLYRVLELKDKNSSVLNEKYEDNYDVIVIDTSIDTFVLIREEISKICKRYARDNIRITFFNSRLGHTLIADKRQPFFSK